jgi:hypothetical protein
MTSLKATLKSDLTSAIRERDEVTAATLRMALTAITNEEVAGEQARVLTDDEVVVILGREAKKRRESASAFDAAARPELADRERAELAVLAGYLPSQLSDEEIAAIVSVAVASAAAGGAEGPRAMGSVMKLVTPQVAGRADGGRVAAIVKAALSP